MKNNEVPITLLIKKAFTHISKCLYFCIALVTKYNKILNKLRLFMKRVPSFQ